MDQQNVQPTALQSKAPVIQKLPYTPPQATYVTLKLEERLQKCAKTYTKCSHDIQSS